MPSLRRMWIATSECQPHAGNVTVRLTHNLDVQPALAQRLALAPLANEDAPVDGVRGDRRIGDADEQDRLELAPFHLIFLIALTRCAPSLSVVAGFLFDAVAPAAL